MNSDNNQTDGSEYYCEETLQNLADENSAERKKFDQFMEKYGARGLLALSQFDHIDGKIADFNRYDAEIGTILNEFFKADIFHIAGADGKPSVKMMPSGHIVCFVFTRREHFDEFCQNVPGMRSSVKLLEGRMPDLIKNSFQHAVADQSLVVEVNATCGAVSFTFGGAGIDHRPESRGTLLFRHLTAS